MFQNSKNEEVALLLIDRGVPLVVSNRSYRVPALHSAAANGCSKVVQRLAKRYRELIYGPLLTPVHKEDEGYQLEPRATDASRKTAMHYLALCPHRDSIRDICLSLMDLGVPLDTPWGDVAISPLLTACALGNFTVATTFVQFGANLRRRDITEQERHRLDGVAIEHRQPNAPYIYTALGVEYQRAQEAGVVFPGSKARWESERQNFIRVFIQHNGKVNEPVSLSGETALSRAADRGLADEIRILILEGGAVADKPDAFGMTPLCRASLRGGLQSVEVGLGRHYIPLLRLLNPHVLTSRFIGPFGSGGEPQPSRQNRPNHGSGADKWYDCGARNRVDHDTATTLRYTCRTWVTSESSSI